MASVTVKVEGATGTISLEAPDEAALRVILRVLGHRVPDVQLSLESATPRRRKVTPRPTVVNPTTDMLGRAYLQLDGNGRKILDALFESHEPKAARALMSVLGKDRPLAVSGTMTTISKRSAKIGVPLRSMVQMKPVVKDGRLENQYRMTDEMRAAMKAVKAG